MINWCILSIICLSLKISCSKSLLRKRLKQLSVIKSLILGSEFVYLQSIERNFTIMSENSISYSRGRKKSNPGDDSSRAPRRDQYAEFSPAWAVVHASDAPGYSLEYIAQIRDGVKKSDWKQFIKSIGATEKELISILPTSMSSLQKKSVYDRKTSERIYELAKLFGLGYDVFDSKDDFREWLMTPSKTLGNKKPWDLLDSSIGFDMVEDEINRIKYNVYS